MNDLSKRLRAYRVRHGPVGYPEQEVAVCLEAADVLDAKDAEIARLRADLARAEGLLRKAQDFIDTDPAYPSGVDLADQIDAFLREREGRCSYCGGEPCCYPSEGKPGCLRDARLRSERAERRDEGAGR